MSRVPTAAELDTLLGRAIELAVQNVEAGHEPFGALVWLDGQVLAEGVNTVHTGDPTAHAETDAVRAAAQALGTPYLPGAVVVASGEPCVMCVASSAVADVAELVFAAPKELVPQLAGPPRPHLPAMQEALRTARPDFVRHVAHPRAAEPFERYVARRSAIEQSAAKQSATE